MPSSRRTHNADTDANVAKTTRKYKLITDTLIAGLARLEADLAYYQSLLKNKNSKDDNEGRNGMISTRKQITRQKQAIALDRAENEKAYRDGDINKFW